ncbi:uncharacterized protein LOC142989698 [Genypterus blacodes]|uniref:uncharacterized protein LOC142989698 n=1 Tax=Genypterus blacodes TaxID=154954 RepID=UPI003F775C9E
MLRGVESRVWACLSCCLLLGLCFPPKGAAAAGAFTSFSIEEESGQIEIDDWEWGSGSSFLHLLNNFPADSPFTTENAGKPVNCTQRFWLPPSSPVCWDNIVGPEEFARSRLLVLQNRAALHAVSTSSGMDDGGMSFQNQATEEVEGIRSDHLSVTETMLTMEEVFVSLEEKRKDGTEQGLLSRIKERMVSARDAIYSREHMANLLDTQLSALETTLLNTQLRLNKLILQ